MKHIKKLLYLIILVVAMGTIKVNAATLNVSIKTSTSKVVVGNTVTYTVTVSSSNYLGSIRYGVTYDTNKLTLTNGTLNAAPAFDGSKKSATYTFTFRAKASGTANFTFNVYEAIDWDFKDFSYNKATSKSVSVITQAQLEASYSKNNNLTKITVDNYPLTPAFDKNKTEYSVEVENEVTSVTLDGWREDTTSSMSGLGKYELAEGVNKLEIKVTAQNGSTKVYTINVTRKELKPIIVTLDGKEYKVIRKKELIEKPNTNYEDSTITIDEEEIPAFENKATNTTLVGLKDEEGNIALYIYKDGNYKLYEEYSFDSIIITEASLKEIPEGYTKSSIKLGEKEIVAYKSDDNKDFYLINGVNISNGEENLYQYNKKENTLQLFDNTLLTKIDKLEDQNKSLIFVIIGLGSLLIITYLVMLISSIRKPKKKKKETVEEDIKEETIEKPIFEEELEVEEKEVPKKKNSSKKKKIEEIDEEIEKNIEKDDKMKEDISNKSKKKKK